MSHVARMQSIYHAGVTAVRAAILRVSAENITGDVLPLYIGPRGSMKTSSVEWSVERPQARPFEYARVSIGERHITAGVSVCDAHEVEVILRPEEHRIRGGADLKDGLSRTPGENQQRNEPPIPSKFSNFFSTSARVSPATVAARQGDANRH